jgi:hypothetical protein
MKIEPGTGGGRPYWTVLVAENEVCEGHPATWIGTILVPEDGMTTKINVWVPASGVPDEKEYKRLARKMLVEAAKSLGYTKIED